MKLMSLLYQCGSQIDYSHLLTIIAQFEFISYQFHADREVKKRRKKCWFALCISKTRIVKRIGTLETIFDCFFTKVNLWRLQGEMEGVRSGKSLPPSSVVFSPTTFFVISNLI